MSLLHFMKGMAHFALPFNKTDNRTLSKRDPKTHSILRALGKVPEHIALVYDSSSAGYCSLFYLLLEISTWDLPSLGIVYITLYDEHGSFKLAAEVLLKEGTIPDSIELWLSGSSSDSIVRSSPHLIINVLSGEDGKAEMVRVIKSLSSTREPVTMEILDATFNEIMNTAVSDSTLFPYEPELLIKLGRHPTIEGYPPWHLRWTETIFTGVSCLRYSLFADCLVQYSKCKQNLGA